MSKNPEALSMRVSPQRRKSFLQPTAGICPPCRFDLEVDFISPFLEAD